MALTLAKVEAVIEGLMTGAQSFSLDGITYQQASLSNWIELRKQLKTEGGTGTGAAHAFGFRVRPMKPPEH